MLMRSMKLVFLSILSVTLLISCVFLVGPGNARAAGSVERIAIETYDGYDSGANPVDPKVLERGSIFWTKIMAYNCVDLKGMSLYLEFDPDVLQLTRVYDSENNIYKDIEYDFFAGAMKLHDPSRDASKVSNPEGWLKCVVSNSSGQSFSDGKSLLAVQFKVRDDAEEEGYIRWIKATATGGQNMLIDSENESIPITVAPLYAPQAGLTTLTLSGEIPTLYVGAPPQTFDLNTLTLAGADQFGNSCDIPQPVTWNSADENIAAVDADGHTLKAVAEGATTVTAAAYGGRTSNPLAVNVESMPPQYTLDIQTDKQEYSIGETIVVSGNLTPPAGGVSIALSIKDSEGQPVVVGEEETESDGSYEWSVILPGTAGAGAYTVWAATEGAATVYTSFEVVPPPGQNANLSNLAISAGTLTPEFNKDITEYTASVENSVESIMVTPTAEDANASITVNGTPVTSGAASEPVALDVGENTITVEVTAENGTTIKTYTVVVTRAEAPSPVLTTLELSGDIPELTVGSAVDLEEILDLTGKDQYGDIYDISGLTVVWSIYEGSGCAYISGSILNATNQGPGSVIATINGITSNPAGFTVKAAPYLAEIIIGPGIPTLTAGETFDLGTLVKDGKDQYGHSFDISGLSVVWEVYDENVASVSGNVLTALSAGTTVIKAVYNGIYSNELSVLVSEVPPYLNAVVLSGNIPEPFYAGNTVSLTLEGRDQYNMVYSLEGLSVSWYIYDTTVASVYSNILTALDAGITDITATINNVTSNILTVTVRPGMPTADPPAGSYTGAQDVELSAEEGAYIYYTIDGSEPTVQSGVYYEGPIAVSVDTIIKAIAFKNGVTSPVATFSYSITITYPKPQVTSTVPDNESVDVAIDSEITVTFDTSIELANADAITINGAPVGSANITINGNELTIAHTAFAYNTSYTVSLAAGSVKSIASGTENDDYSWSFTTSVGGVVTGTVASQVSQVGSLDGVQVKVLETGKTTTTNEEGAFTITGLNSGQYTIEFKAVMYLVKRVLVDVQENSVKEIGTIQLTVGDVNGDDVVGGGDYSWLFTAWNTAVSDWPTDSLCRRCDFNGDEIMGGGDYSWLFTNWNKIGDSK